MQNYIFPMIFMSLSLFFLCVKGKKVWKTFVFTPLFYNFACKLFLDGCEFSPPFDY